MAAAIPSAKHQNLNAEPIREDPSKFYYHFLYKAVIVGIFLVILPLFPSQAPEFINQSLLTRNWELLHLLLVGIAISYGLFSRRNDETEKENNNSKFDTAQSYVSRFLQVSSFSEDEGENETPSASDENKIQTWNNYQYYRNEPVVVVDPKNSNFYQQSATCSRISEKPLLLPVRSLKSRVSDPCSDHSVNESSPTSASLNRSSSKSGSRRFSRNIETEGSGCPKMEDELKDNVVLPSPIPWRSESLIKSQTLRSSRSNSMSSSPSQSSPNSKELSLSPSFPSESLAKTSEDIMRNKAFFKFPIPPPPPPPPMLFKSLSTKPPRSAFNHGASFDKEMKRSFTSERKDKPRGLVEKNAMGRSMRSIRRDRNIAEVRRGMEIGEGEINGRVENRSQWEAEEDVVEEPTRKTVAFLEDDKVIMGFDEDTETEDDGDDDVVENLVVKDRGESPPTEESSRTDKTDHGTGCSSSVGEEGPDVDKKADEFIAKFREQIRLQRIDSIKRSARITRNSSR